MVIQHNMQAMNANRMLGGIVSSQSKTTERLSSGYRINRAGDDAAGLAISEKMRGQIRGLDKASSNAQDGISLVQTAEGALQESQNIIQRMRELAVQASNDTNTDDDRTQIQNEIDQLTQEVDRIANTTEFNSKKLLDGSLTGSVSAKDGKATLEGSFSNSLVNVSFTKNNADKSSYTDVIRLEINSDFSEGQSTKGTQKVSEETINKINSMVTTGGAVTLDKVLQEAAGQQITNAGYSTNNSTAENIKGAVDAVKTALSAVEASISTSSAAVATNRDAIEKTVDGLMKKAGVTKNATTGASFIKEGVTKEDITSALTGYIDALTKNGTAGATGSDNDIKEALTKLESLFNSGSTDKVGAAIDAGDVIGAATKKADGSANTQLKFAAATAGTTTLGAVATDVATKLATYAKEMATTAITDNVNKAKAAQLSDTLEILNNTELTTAIVDYKKAETEKDALAPGTASDEQIAEAQEKVDDAKAVLDKLNTASSPIKMTDLFGSSSSNDKFSVASKLNDDNSLDLTIKGKDGSDSVITIANADKLKAGDVLTITSEAAVDSRPAATGSEALRLQIGANAGQEMSLGINSMKAESLNIVQTKEGVEGKALSVTTQASASLAVNAYDLAIQKVSTERAKMGAVQNRLEHTIANLDNTSENVQSAESSIRDVDMATEMVSYSKNNILQQAAQSMLAQANQSTQGVLSLLQ